MSDIQKNQTLMAFDFGEKRIGVAIGNTLTRTCEPLTIIGHTQTDERFAQIQERQAELSQKFSENALDATDQLPRTILYNLNPADNYVLGTMIGNFQDGSIPGKVQFGSGWWFLDQKEGMEWQMNTLSNLGLLSRFVGMITDSRSFMSYPRHEYFRRVLCNLIGRDVEGGEIPNDEQLLGTMIRNICYRNANLNPALGL